MLLRKSAKVEKDPYEEDDIFEESEMMNVGIVEAESNGEPSRKMTHLDSKGCGLFISYKLITQKLILKFLTSLNVSFFVELNVLFA